MTIESEIASLAKRALAFAREANKVLASQEASTARVITLKQTYSLLGGLSLKQDELLRQALRCIEHTLYRAAHVLAWAGFMDFIEEELAKDNFQRLNSIKTAWNVKSLEDLRETVSDYQVIEALRKLKLCSKTEERALHGLLNKRNECAHPTDYYPLLNETLGYISEILQRIGMLQKKWR